jgi:hypothetical protein
LVTLSSVVTISALHIYVMHATFFLLEKHLLGLLHHHCYYHKYHEYCHAIIMSSTRNGYSPTYA